MAGKSRRVASRQAQLSRRRKQQQKGAGGPSIEGHAPVEVDGQGPETTTPRETVPSSLPPSPTPTAPAAPSRVTAPSASAQPAPARRAPGRSRLERPATQNYVGAEMRRILLMASGVLGTIVVLGFIL